MVDLPQDQMTRVKALERERDWPDEIKIVAKWGHRRREHVITKEEYFGISPHGAPISGDTVLRIIDKLRRQRPHER